MTQNIYDDEDFFREYSRLPRSVAGLDAAPKWPALLAGLGRSSTARFYGISSIDEARAYLAHPLLGPRLDLCTRIVLASECPSLHALFGSPDDLKFRSCMTLFAYAAGERSVSGAATVPPGVFSEALQGYFAGEEDPLTRGLLTSAS